MKEKSNLCIPGFLFSTTDKHAYGTELFDLVFSGLVIFWEGEIGWDGYEDKMKDMSMDVNDLSGWDAYERE